MTYDIFGDIHGCYDEMIQLLYKLGYSFKEEKLYHPHGNKPIFLGDITDRGYNSIDVIKFVYQLVVIDKKGYYVPGNHCNKLYRYFLGNPVKINNGLETTVKELEQLSNKNFLKVRQKFMQLYEQSPLYLHFKEEQLIVAHAGINEKLIGRYDKEVESFVLYGDTTGEVLEDGRPVRRDWAKKYFGKDFVVYGHTPVLQPRWINNTINIDTGCVFGNKLTAFRFSNKEIFFVQSSMPLREEKFKTFTNE